jgi:hypothetical protein
LDPGSLHKEQTYADAPPFCKLVDEDDDAAWNFADDDDTLIVLMMMMEL